jgi:hypothetical protein
MYVEFSAGEITTTQDLDYETLSRNGLLTTQVDIRVYDQREYSEWRRFNIIVDDVNETPEFDQTVYHIETLEGTVCCTHIIHKVGSL